LSSQVGRETPMDGCGPVEMCVSAWGGPTTPGMTPVAARAASLKRVARAECKRQA